MPPKKAAKKAASKHADPKHHERKDLRRAYEHLGRVEILQKNVSESASKDVHTLVRLAEQELGKGHRKDAADLLRAAEHFSFADLASTGAQAGKVSGELSDVIQEEFEHLARKVQERWDESEEDEHHAPLTALFQKVLKSAPKAMDAGEYRKALELARGAEALAHVTRHGTDELDGGSPQPKLPKP